MRVSDFDFPLPPEQIAQAPPAERGTSRLLILERATGRITHAHIGDLPAWLRTGDLLVVNDTRVYPARLLGRREPSGGRVEVFLLERLGPDRFDALVHPGQKLKPGALVVLEGDPGPDGSPSPRLYGRIEGRGSFGRRTIRFAIGAPPDPGPAEAGPPPDLLPASSRPRPDEGPAIDRVVDRIGHMPLPPYIARPDAGADRERYQTVYARERGSVAAPTAGLHFTPAILAALDAAGVERAAVTLHVGYGTFKPVRVEDVEAHVVDPERYTIAPDVAARLNAAQGRGPADRRGRHDHGPRARIGRARWTDRRRRRRRRRVPLPRRDPDRARRRAAHQLPPAALVAAHAGVRVCRPGGRASRVS